MAKFLRITAKRAGYRRAGIAHPGTAVDHPVDNFSTEEVHMLKTDAGLVVHEVDLPDERQESDPPRAERIEREPAAKAAAKAKRAGSK